MNAELDVLRRAGTSVELGPVGYAAVVTDACRAYQALASKPDAVRALEPELVDIVRGGSPAAIIYGALLLRTIGRGDLKELLAPYADDRRPCVVWPGGCGGDTHWLAEATRWVFGEMWSHPARLLENEIQTIERASWLELPNEAVMMAAPTNRRNGRLAQGVWTFSFAELFVSRTLAAGRPSIERLVTNGNAAVRIYGALLLWRIDREAGERALDALGSSGTSVDVIDNAMLRGWRTRPTPIAQAIVDVRTWLSANR